MSEIKQLTKRIITFRDERGWAKHHRPKDLALSLVLEVAEVLEHFQWKNGRELERYLAAHREDLADEIADVFVYLLHLSEGLGIDLVNATRRKMKKNAKKYPVERVKGSARKYTAYEYHTKSDRTFRKGER